MPKIVKNPKTRREINEASMARRGIVNKAFKLHEDTVTLVKDLSEKTDKSLKLYRCTPIRTSNDDAPPSPSYPPTPCHKSHARIAYRGGGAGLSCYPQYQGFFRCLACHHPNKSGRG